MLPPPQYFPGELKDRRARRDDSVGSTEYAEAQLPDSHSRPSQQQQPAKLRRLVNPELVNCSAPFAASQIASEGARPSPTMDAECEAPPAPINPRAAAIDSAWGEDGVRPEIFERIMRVKARMNPSHTSHPECQCLGHAPTLGGVCAEPAIISCRDCAFLLCKNCDESVHANNPLHDRVAMLSLPVPLTPLQCLQLGHTAGQFRWEVVATPTLRMLPDSLLSPPCTSGHCNGKMLLHADAASHESRLTYVDRNGSWLLHRGGSFKCDHCGHQHSANDPKLYCSERTFSSTVEGFVTHVFSADLLHFLRLLRFGFD